MKQFRLPDWLTAEQLELRKGPDRYNGQKLLWTQFDVNENQRERCRLMELSTSPGMALVHALNSHFGSPKQPVIHL